MSLINDALNKAQQQRSQPREATLYRTPGYRPGYRRPAQVKSFGFIWVNAVIIAILFGVALLYLRTLPRATASDPVADARRALPAPAPEHESPTVAAPPTTPVLPPPGPVMPAPSDYELVGMSAMGSTTLLSVVRRSDKRSLWVPVGKTVGEVTAVSYDATNDRAVIRVNGVPQTIALRDAGPGATSTHIGE